MNTGADLPLSKQQSVGWPLLVEAHTSLAFGPNGLSWPNLMYSNRSMKEATAILDATDKMANNSCSEESSQAGIAKNVDSNAEVQLLAQKNMKKMRQSIANRKHQAKKKQNELMLKTLQDENINLKKKIEKIETINAALQLENNCLKKYLLQLNQFMTLLSSK